MWKIIILIFDMIFVSHLFVLYYVMAFLFCLSSSCVNGVASAPGLSILLLLFRVSFTFIDNHIEYTVS